MKVLYFHQHFGTPRSSTGTRSYEFARALIARGHRVTMVCGAHELAGLELPYDHGHRWSRGEIDGIDVIVLPLSYSNRDGLIRRTILFLKFALRSTRLALREDYDVLFATSAPLTAGIPGLVMKAFRRGRPFVFEVRDLWPDLPYALGMRNPVLLGGMKVLERLSYWASDACIALSPGILEGIRDRSPRGRRIELIPNGCDLELFRPRTRAELRIDGVGSLDFVAAFAGAHGTANGLDAVLDAAIELRNRGRTGIKLVFIGDGREKARLIDRAHREKLDNCLFLKPMIKSELARLTGSVDCGLMVLANVPAFYYGTSPNKFFDYISAGRPVINNYPGWLADMINGHSCGMVVPPENPRAFADALCQMADAAERRSTLGQNARRLAEAEFSRERLANQFVDLLEAICKRVA